MVRRKKSRGEFSRMDGNEEEEEQELVRVDSWMQSVVPSLPKRAAIVCLVFNILIPGLGTFTGGLLSCCIGRPRLDFHPAKYRCPTAFLVTVIGVTQFLCTAFFFVGWLWSIIWGFLMLNLSDPKFRVMPKPPPSRLPPGSLMNPTVKVVKPLVNVEETLDSEQAAPGKKNFGRLINKAMDNKDQALGLTPPPPPPLTSTLSVSTSTSTSTSTGAPQPSTTNRSILSRLNPITNCTGTTTATNYLRSKINKAFGANSRSNSQSSLLSGGGDLDSVTTDSPKQRNIVRDTFGNWRQMAIKTIANGTEPNSPALTNGGISNSTSISESEIKENTFNGIVSVTPATPIHSSNATSIVDDDFDDSTMPVEEAWNPVGTTNKHQVAKELPNTVPVELPVIPTTEKSSSVSNESIDKANGPQVVEPALASKTMNQVVGPISTKAIASNTVNINSTTATSAINALKNQLRPKMQQSMTYHYDA